MLDELLRHKNGIQVRTTTDLGVVSKGQTRECQISIENSSRVETVLAEVKVTGHQDSWVRTSEDWKCPVIIDPGRSFVATFRVEAKAFGKNKVLINFTFRQKNEEAESVFSIGAQVGSFKSQFTYTLGPHCCPVVLVIRQDPPDNEFGIS